MLSLDDVYDFDMFTFQQKKAFIEDVVRKKFALNCSSYFKNIVLALLAPLVGIVGALAIQDVIIPQILASIVVNRIASELQGQITMRQICDFIISTIDFFLKKRRRVRLVVN